MTTAEIIEKITELKELEDMPMNSMQKLILLKILSNMN